MIKKKKKTYTKKLLFKYIIICKTCILFTNIVKFEHACQKPFFFKALEKTA